MAYHFMNRRGKSLTLVFWESNKPDLSTRKFSRNQGHEVLGGWTTVFGDPRAKHDVKDGSSLDWESETPALTLYVQGAVVVGPLAVQKGRHYILRSQIDSPLLNVEDALGELEDRLGLPRTVLRQTAVETPHADQAGAIALAVASALLSGLATGLSAAGPQFAVGAGAVASLDGLLNLVAGIAMGGFQPEPPPPSLEEVTDEFVGRMRKVLREENARRDAEKATNVLDNTVEYFANRLFSFTADPGATTDTGGESRGRKKYKFASPVAREFERELEKAMSVTDQDTFASQLRFVARTPDIGKFMLPTFMSAIGMWATLRRIQLGLAYVPERGRSNVPKAELVEFTDQLKAFKSGLLGAMKAYVAYRTALLDEFNMGGLPHEALVLVKRMGDALLGDGLAIPDPMYKKYTSDSDYERAEGSGWNYEQATGSKWLNESGYFVTDASGKTVISSPPLDVYGKALADIQTAIDRLADDAAKIDAGAWPTNVLPVSDATPQVG